MATISHDSGMQDTLRALPKQGWYYGNISEQQCKDILKNERTGAFLIKDLPATDSEERTFSLVYKIENRYNDILIDYSYGRFSFYYSSIDFPKFRTLMDLVSFCTARCNTCERPLVTLRAYLPDTTFVGLSLTKPISRLQKMHSLSYLCRFKIAQLVTRDKLSQLGLPVRLVQNYLMNNLYFDEELYINWESTEQDRVIRTVAMGIHPPTRADARCH